jgi:tRNA-2-methylthio-N6-dimethylallyladenosine synthase
MKEIQDLWDKVLRKLHFWAKCSYLWYGGGLKKEISQPLLKCKQATVDFDQLLKNCGCWIPKNENFFYF